MTPEVVFIDWDGTASTSRFWDHWQEANPDKYLKIQQNLFVESPELVSSWMLGELSAEEVCYKLSLLTGIADHELFANLEISCRNMEFVSPDVLGLVSEIRDKGMRVLIATDNMDTFNRWTVPALGLDEYYDGVLNSFFVQAFKKEGEKFFGHYLSQNNIEPNLCLIIDDSQHNLEPLTQYGFDYRKIERGVGLVSELQNILLSLE